jgi:DNA-binding beta-propeller fold protein YncE
VDGSRQAQAGRLTGEAAMTLLVTSATGANGAGYGKILAFADDGKPIGVFGDDPRVVDPRGLGIDQIDDLLFVNSGSNRILALDRNGVIVRASQTVDGLNPGGGNFGPDGRYYAGLRGERTIMAFTRELDSAGEYVLPPQIVPFPRGFAFAHDGRLFLASGIGPGGDGDNTILAFDPDRRMLPSWKVRDPQLSPLDLAIAPNGNIVVSSEHPFGAANAVTTIREHDHADGQLVRIFVPNDSARFRKPRGLRFGPRGRLYCVAEDEVIAFDFETGDYLGPIVTLPGLNGQALVFFP